MLRGLKNKVSGLFVAGLLLCGIGLAVLAPNTEATATSELDAEITFESDVVSHLMKVRGINAEEATRRTNWQNHAAELNGRLTDNFPSADFGGVWIDKDTDRVKVGVLNRSKPGGSNHRALAEEVRNNQLEDAADYVEVERSYAELRAIKSWISQAAVERVGGTEWPIQVGIRPSVNQVIVQIPQDERHITSTAKELIEEAKVRYGEAIQFTTYSHKPTLEACNWWFCDSPLRGAVGIKGSENGYDGIMCTAGFNVVGNSGTRYVVTAGHCYPAGHGWATETYNYTTKKIGPVHSTLYDDPGTSKMDAMIIEVKEATYGWSGVIGKIMVRSGSVTQDGQAPPSYNEEYDITDWGNNNGLDTEGARICVSGAISSSYEGGSCGKVYDVDVDWEADGVRSYHLMRASYCSRGGDSGMPVFRLGKALGVHRGRSGVAGCGGADRYYTGMKSIIEGFNNTISIY